MGGEKDAMTSGHYSLLAALIFAFVVALQLVRAIRRWPVTIGTTSIPIWVSWVSCVVAAILAWLGFAASQA